MGDFWFCRFFQIHKEHEVNIEDCADTTGGELLKAAFLIFKRYEAVGEMAGEVGAKYVNRPARYIMERYTGTEMDAAVNALWGLQDRDAYKEGTRRLCRETAKWVESHPELLKEENEWDCLEFDGPEDDIVEVEEDEWDGVDQRELDLAEYPPLDWRR